MDRHVVLDLDSPDADSRSSAHATWNDFEAWVRREHRALKQFRALVTRH